MEKELTLQNSSGLHARPAAIFVKAVQRFSSTVTVRLGEKEVSGRSLLSLLSLGAGKGSRITLRAEGPDAEAALAELSALIESGLGDA